MNIIKYTDFIFESNSYKKQSLIDKLSSLGSFIVDRSGVNMRESIDRILKEVAISKDYNDSYQLPLSILYKTGKFSDIKKMGDKYQTDKLKNLSLVVDENDKWHQIGRASCRERV